MELDSMQNDTEQKNKCLFERKQGNIKKYKNIKIRQMPKAYGLMNKVKLVESNKRVAYLKRTSLRSKL
jgi:hypothetical protein